MLCKPYHLCFESKTNGKFGMCMEFRDAMLANELQSDNQQVLKLQKRIERHDAQLDLWRDWAIVAEK